MVECLVEVEEEGEEEEGGEDDGERVGRAVGPLVGGVGEAEAVTQFEGWGALLEEVVEGLRSEDGELV